MVACNKCRRAPAKEPDTWCLACRGVEILNKELAGVWHCNAVRSLAEDQVVAAARAVRGLRSLGTSLDSAEKSRASVRAASRERSPRRSSGAPRYLPAPPPPPAPVVRPKGESYSEFEESEEEDTREGDPPITTKAKSDPTRQPPEPALPPRESSRGAHEHHRERGDQEHQTKKKKKSKRDGRKHARHHRGLDRPDLPLPRRPPQTYWEERPSLEGHSARRDRR